jgi:tetratricopeptide (TPR) repeat protein
MGELLRKPFIFVAFFIILLLLLIGSAAAQNINRIVKGSVKDDHGQPVQDAYLEIYRTDGCYKRSTRTNEKGEFAFTLGADYPGTYFLDVRKAGLKNGGKSIKPKMAEEPPFIEFNLTPGQEEKFLWDMTAYPDITLTPQIKASPTIRKVYSSGVSAYRRRTYDQAIENLMTASELAPKESWIWYYLGLAYEEKGLYAEALQAYDKAIECDNANKTIIVQKAEFLLKAGAIGERLQDIKQTAVKVQRQSDTGIFQCHSYIGKILDSDDNDKHDEAIKAFSRAVAIDPKFPETHYYLGLALARNQDTVCEAVKEMKIYLGIGEIAEFKEVAKDMLEALKDATKGQPCLARRD